MSRLIIRLPTTADIECLSQQMRQVDRAELTAMGRTSPAIAIKTSLLRTDPRYQLAAEYDGQLLCIAGCATHSMISTVGIPWLLATDAMNKHGKRLTQDAKRGLAVMLQRWPVLSNVVDQSNQKTIDWLALLGFEFNDASPIVPGYPLLRFTLRRDDLV